MSAGIYKITVGPNFYYGQAVDLKIRRRQHLRRLKRGSHDNPQLQRSYDKYGAVEVATVLLCDPENLNFYESKLVDSFIKKANCCNLMHVQEDGTHKLAEETKRKIGEALRGKVCRNNNVTTKQPVEITTKEDKVFTFESITKAAEFLNCSYSLLARYFRGDRPWPKRRNTINLKHGRYLPKPQVKYIPKAYEGNRKAVKVVFPDGNYTTYRTVTAAAEAIGMAKNDLSRRILGNMPWPTKKGNKHIGLRAYYVEE